MLHAEAIDLYYGASRALRGVSIGATKGRITCLLGRNGVGKSTLLATIMGHTTLQGGRVPWVALMLAVSFAIYGLMRKTGSLGALEGLTLETLLLAPLVLPLLVWFTLQPGGAMARGDWALNGWLWLSGPLTALPLLFFAAAARRLPLATVGLVQYLSPTLQFRLGVQVFGEPMQPARLAGFVLIWAGLAVYSGHAWWRGRRLAAALARASLLKP